MAVYYHLSGQPQRSVMIGELARCYPDEEMARVFSIMGAAHSFGFTIAPGLNILFASVDIRWGKLRLTFANISGVYMAFMFLCAQIVSYFMVSDLSREHDLKEHGRTVESPPKKLSQVEEGIVENDTQNNGEGQGEVEAEGEGEGSIWFILTQLFTHCDTCLLLGLQFIETFFVFAMGKLYCYVVIIKSMNAILFINLTILLRSLRLSSDANLSEYLD